MKNFLNKLINNIKTKATASLNLFITPKGISYSNNASIDTPVKLANELNQIEQVISEIAYKVNYAPINTFGKISLNFKYLKNGKYRLAIVPKYFKIATPTENKVTEMLFNQLSNAFLSENEIKKLKNK